MIYLYILLAWVAISIFSLGSYGVFLYIARRKRDLPLVIGDDPTPIKHDDKLRNLLESGQEFLAPHLCLLCANPVELPTNLSSYKNVGGYDINGNFVDPPEKEPYCNKCHNRLEREGFFEE